jgi:hypothetical protein
VAADQRAMGSAPVFQVRIRRTSPAVAVRRLALSRAITFAGGNSAFIALSSVLYAETRSASWVAAAAFASFAVPALVSPLAGMLGDRFDRRTIMITSELSGAVCFLVMALVAAPAALLAMRVIASLAAAPFVPATTAALPKLVVREEALPRANAALVSASWVGAVVGPLLAGLSLAGMGGSFVFAVNSGTFVISAMLIASVRGDFSSGGKATTSAADLAAGFKVLFGGRVLRPVSLAYGGIFLGIGVSIPAEIALSTALNAGPVGYSALFFLWAIGGILGAKLGARIVARVRPLALLSVAAAGLALGFSCVAMAPVFAVALVGMSVGGASQGLWMVGQGLLIQMTVPDLIRGRAFASSEALEQGGLAIGLLGAAAVAAAAGPRGAFAIAASASLLGASILFAALRQSRPAQACSWSFGSRAMGRERGPGGASPDQVRRPAPVSPPPAHAAAVPT